jgi:hypothetical protein
MTVEERRRHARELVADWPALTEQQRTRIAVALQVPPVRQDQRTKKAA